MMRRAFLKSLQSIAVASLFAKASVVASSPGESEPDQIRSVREFGATGDGKTNDRDSIRAAFRTTSRVLFPAGDYFLGDTSDGTNVFDLHGRNNIELANEGVVRFIVETRKKVFPAVFVISGGADAQIGSFEFIDIGGDNSVKWQGAIGLLFIPGHDQTRTARIGRIKGVGLTAVLTVRGVSGSRIWGVNVREIVADDCYYGVCCQDNGNDIEIDQLVTQRCLRSYFVYGVKAHRVNIISNNGKAASADVLVKRYRYDTTNLNIRYKCIDSQIRSPNGLVVFEQQPDNGTAPGLIRNVTLDVSVDAKRCTGVPILFRSYTSAGVAETSTRNNWQEITVQAGTIQSAAGVVIDSLVVPSGSAQLAICGISSKMLSDAVARSFQLTFLCS